MKKIFFLVLMVAGVFLDSNAQTEKSTWLLGGGIGFTSLSASGGGSVSVFQLNPNVGYFVNNNFAVGAELDLVSSEGTSVWAVGPYARVYLSKEASGKLFAQAGVGFGGTSEGGSATSFLGKFGYAIFLNKSIAVELAVNFGAGNGTTTLGAGAGFQIHFAPGNKK